VKFRSKLEARWAVFFDHYGMSWEYELMSFRLQSGLIYCPDFLLKDFKCFAEVKPNIPLSQLAIRKIEEFTQPIALLKGLPLENTFELFHLKWAEYSDNKLYPCFDKDSRWRWWSTGGEITCTPNGRDIKESADYARYYDFFNF